MKLVISKPVAILTAAKTWHHIALTYDKTMAEALVYVDGQVVRAFVDMEGPLDTSSEVL